MGSDKLHPAMGISYFGPQLVVVWLCLAVAVIFSFRTTAIAGSVPPERLSTDSTGSQSNGHSDGPSISGNGRHVAFESYANNLVPGDTNNAMDIFVKDTQTGVTTRVSTDSSGNQANCNSSNPNLSADSHYVVFVSCADYLVPGDTNGEPDVFVKDTQTGVTIRVSTDSSGNQANPSGGYYHFGSSDPSISADGRYVAFDSNADNLVSGDTNGNRDVFVKDTYTGVTIRVSSTAGGGQVHWGGDGSAISATGRFVAFASWADDLVPGGNHVYDIYVKDTLTGNITCASTDSSGNRVADGGSNFPSISGDGRYVAFESHSPDLVSGDNDKNCPSYSGMVFHCREIYVKDTLTGTISRISNDFATGGQPNGQSADASISANGERVAYWSNASNLVSGDTNGKADVFVWDAGAGRTTRISTDAGGNEGNGLSKTIGVTFVNVSFPTTSKTISADGRYVAFVSDATNLVPGDTNNARDIFLASASPTVTTRKSYWPWYDSRGGRAWLLLANRAGTPYNQSFEAGLAGQPLNLSAFSLSGPSCPSGSCALGQVPPGMTITPLYSGLMGGPLVANARPGERPLLASERVLWGGLSLEEIPGIDEGRLSDHYFWPWYDQLTPGTTDWVVLSNPSVIETLHATVSFVNEADGKSVQAESDIAPGDFWAPTFPGEMGGPVEVKAYLAGGSWPTDARRVIPSQRILSSGGAAFNEVAGTPAGELSDRYLWTWYDEKSAGAHDWVLVANPPDAATGIYYDVYIANQKVESDSYGGVPGTPIPPGGKVAPHFTGIMGGPVEVRTYSNAAHTIPANSIASQRTLWGPSFDEVPGFVYSSLASDYNWTWYDQVSPGSINWVIVANPNPNPIDYSVKIAGNTVFSDTLEAAGDPAGGDRAIPVFSGVMGGPVEVTSMGGNVIASQRVLWSGYLNEMLGTVLD